MRRQQERLAIEGGHPVRTEPFAPWPAYTTDEIEAVIDVLKSGNVNYHKGKEGRLFEEEFAAATQNKYAVAVSNGTVALELALRALEVGPGDEVIVPSRTFVASASCVMMRGATPVFVDVSEESGTVTAESIEQAVGKKTKAVIVVHLAGWPCEMDKIQFVARKHDLCIIEDCAQAQGAEYKNRPVGSFGDASAFSFCQDKIMSTGGEGGMLVTSNKNVWEKAWSYKDHGKDFVIGRRAERSQQFEWIHNSIGTNWRITEMQAAIGRRLLAKVPGYVKERQHNASILTNLLRTVPGIRVTNPSSDVNHAYYKYYAFIRPQQLREDWNRDKILTAVNAEGIPCFAGSCSEVYLEKAFPDSVRPRQYLPAARQLGQTSLMFLVHPGLWNTEMTDTFEAIKKVLSKATNLADPTLT
jgi:hypothetical protein